MNPLIFMLPCCLLVHNMIDFRVIGAPESYATKLSVVFTEWIERLEANNNNIRFINRTGEMGECGFSSLGLQFESNDRLDIAQGRAMLLQLIDSTLRFINSSDCLRPYICSFPFTPCNIEIRVNFVGECAYNFFPTGQLKYMSFIDGTLTYYGENVCGNLERLRSESLDFAQCLYIPPQRAYLDPNCYQ